MTRRGARITILLAITAAIVSGTALFRVSQQVQTAENEKSRLESAVSSEREAIRVLNAEWDYLNRPDRLEDLAVEHLNMQPPQPRQMQNAPDTLPPPAIVSAPQETPAPEITAQPAVYEGPAASAVPVPAAKPKRGREKDFTRMLGDLAPAGGAQ
ncbi:MAG TPA: hypothetical protein VIG74_02130 [Alphaproteobacteria bacterium]|jgi:cell division protein FtsL